MTQYLALAKGVIYAALLATVFVFGRSCGKKAGSIEVANLKAEHSLFMANLAENTTIAAERAREAEQAQAKAFADADQQHLEDLADAHLRSDQLVADIRSEHVRLRSRWRCPLPGAPQAGAGPGQPDAEADDRAESAGRIVRAAAECDAQVIGLQSILTAERMQ